MHRLIAIRLRENPTLLDVARQMLNRWKRVSHNAALIENGRTYFSGDMDTLIAAIVGDTDGQRLRQSNQIVSVLSISERETLRAYAEAEHVATVAGETAMIAHNAREPEVDFQSQSGHRRNLREYDRMGYA